jgi:hypothetical protein
MKQEFEDGDIITSQYSDVSFIFPYRGTDEGEGGVLTEVFYCTKNCNLHYHSGYYWMWIYKRLSHSNSRREAIIF